MQFGVYSVSDITSDPTTNIRVSDSDRIKGLVRIARHAEHAGLDVFALGEHHNPPFVSSSPTTTLAYIGAKTKRILLSTASTLVTTNDPVKLAEDYSTLQQLVDGRLDILLGRGNTTEVYPWFGKDISDGIELAIENYALLRELWTNDVVNWQGQFRSPLEDFTAVPRPLNGQAPFVWHASIRSPEIAEQAAFYGDGFFHNHIFGSQEEAGKLIELYRKRFAHYGHGRPEQAIVGLGGQVYIADKSQDAFNEFRPYFDHAAAYGNDVSLEEYSQTTALCVGSPEQVIEKILSFRDQVGDYQRQLFLIDHAGLPLQTVLKQIDFLGEEVVPVLRKEFDSLRPAGVPSDPPLHSAHLALIEQLSDRRILNSNLKPGPTTPQADPLYIEQVRPYYPEAAQFPYADAIDDVTGAAIYPQTSLEDGVASARELLTRE